jgi:uncharacterized membrane protein
LRRRTETGATCFEFLSVGCLAAGLAVGAVFGFREGGLPGAIAGAVIGGLGGFTGGMAFIILIAWFLLWMEKMRVKRARSSEP